VRFGTVPLIKRSVDEWGRPTGTDLDWMMEYRGSVNLEYELTAAFLTIGNTNGTFQGNDTHYEALGLALGARRTIHRQRLSWAHGLAGVIYYERASQYVGAIDTTLDIQTRNGFGVMATAGTELRLFSRMTVPVEFMLLGAMARRPAVAFGATLGLAYGWGELIRRDTPRKRHWWDDL
jgi:hypothetical protein